MSHMQGVDGGLHNIDQSTYKMMCAQRWLRGEISCSDPLLYEVYVRSSM